MIKIDKSDVIFNKAVFEEFLAKENLHINETYISFLEIHNGGQPESNIVKTKDSTEEFSINDIYGVGLEEYSNIIDVYYRYKDRMPVGYLAIAYTEGGNLVCIDTNVESTSLGAIYLWDHDNELPDDEFKSEIYCVSDTFTDFIEMIHEYDGKDIEELGYEVKSVWIDPDFLNEINNKK